MCCGGECIEGVCVVDPSRFPTVFSVIPTVVARFHSPCRYEQDERNPSNGRTTDSESMPDVYLSPVR
jgi:hypothetical protein